MPRKKMRNCNTDRGNVELAIRKVTEPLGDRIRGLRQKQGITQDVFARLCGFHRSHMGEIERGENNLTLETLKTLSRALKVSISDLFRGIG